MKEKKRPRTEIQITEKQREFIEATAFEVLFGGAAGGGKSYGQLIDALIYASRYPRSRQLILRRTFPELDKSLIRVSQELFPRDIYTYSGTMHVGKFKNGSVLDFGYCDAAADVYKYQSAEYDVIRFDELTHFAEETYVYLMSRIRGANGYPKAVKSTTNPGGIGHAWVKERFIDIGQAGKVHEFENTSRVFIPAKATDNRFLMDKDPMYIKRLLNLSECDKKALLHGDWDIFEGRYFTEWSREKHVIEAQIPPKNHRRYVAMDYGLDMLAAYFIAVDETGRATVYREIYEKNLIISDAAKKIRESIMPDEEIYAFIAPPDLWNRRQDTGRSAADIFAANGVPLSQASNDRIQGFLELKEYLKLAKDEFGESSPKIKITANCLNLIRTLPQLAHDRKNPNDVAIEPHEITHATDAIRYFVSYRPLPAGGDDVQSDEDIEEFLRYGR